MKNLEYSLNSMFFGRGLSAAVSAFRIPHSALAIVSVVILLLQVSTHAQTAEIKQGSHLKVRLSREISTKTAEKGEEFDSLLTDDFTQEEKVLIPKGSLLKGNIVRVTRAGRMRGRAELALHFRKVELPTGESFDISATPVAADSVDVTEEGTIRGGSSGKQTTAAAAAGAAAGAAIGAAADGKKGAAIGAGVGIIAGIIGSNAAGSKDQVLKKGTILELVLDRTAFVPLRSVRR